MSDLGKLKATFKEVKETGKDTLREMKERGKVTLNDVKEKGKTTVNNLKGKGMTVLKDAKGKFNSHSIPAGGNSSHTNEVQYTPSGPQETGDEVGEDSEGQCSVRLADSTEAK